MKRQSAYSTVLKEQQQHAGTQEKADTLQDGKTVITQETAKGQTKTSQRVKVTFYLEQEQVDKLDAIIDAFKKRKHLRLNQQEVMRMLIDEVDIEDLVK